MARLISTPHICATYFFCLRTESNFTARQDLSQSTATLSVLPLLFMPWPVVVLMTRRGVFGLSWSNQGHQSCREYGSVQIPLSLCVSVCVSHICLLPVRVRLRASLVSGCNCAAPHSLLLCLDLIRVLSDRAVHGSRLGCPRNPTPKFLMAGMSLRRLATGI